METLTVKIPHVLNNKLNYYLKKKQLNKSEVMRKALKEYLRDNAKNTGSFFDHASDLAGCVEAKSDLSANKAYLNEYGK